MKRINHYAQVPQIPSKDPQAEKHRMDTFYTLEQNTLN